MCLESPSFFNIWQEKPAPYMTINMYIFDISLISSYSQESFKQVALQGHLQSKHV